MLSQTSFHFRRHSIVRPHRWHVFDSFKYDSMALFVTITNRLQDFLSRGTHQAFGSSLEQNAAILYDEIDAALECLIQERRIFTA